ncbi:hypothetical protein HWV62_21928 [Athelia sp. TMB]|nr:hypothetical protein HWV62_21928 [Athelia sp. TMB]
MKRLKNPRIDQQAPEEYREKPQRNSYQEDRILVPPEEDKLVQVFTAYKSVAKKVKPVSGTFPEAARVRRTIPEDPLATVPKLSPHPPKFAPSQHLTQERLDSLEINKNGFLSEEEQRLFEQVVKNNEKTLAFEETDRGTLKDSYFSPYIMPVVPHEPWELKNIPIPPGIRDKVIAILKEKLSAGVYEPSQSSYRSRWFCVLKKNGKLRLVHDLQPLNKISIVLTHQRRDGADGAGRKFRKRDILPR